MAAVGGGAAHVVDRARGGGDALRGSDSASASGARHERRAPAPADPNAARSSPRSVDPSASEHDRDHHRVARPDLHERLRPARRRHVHRDDQLVRRERVALRADEELAQRQRPRAARRSRRSTSAPATSSGGSASPAGDAVPRLPPIVPRLRICGDPTVRDASARAGSAGELGVHRLRVRQPRAEPHRPFSRDQPRSSAHLVQVQQRSAAARGRS